MYQEKIVGQPCSVCGQPYVMGKKGVYCVACYKVWANQNKPQSPQTQNFAPQQSFTPQGNTNMPLDQFLTKEAFNKTLDAQRLAFKEMAERIAELTRQVEYFKELWKLKNPTAFEVHKDQLEEIPVIGKDNFVDDASKALGL